MRLRALVSAAAVPLAAAALAGCNPVVPNPNDTTPPSLEYLYGNPNLISGPGPQTLARNQSLLVQSHGYDNGGMRNSRITITGSGDCVYVDNGWILGYGRRSYTLADLPMTLPARADGLAYDMADNGAAWNPGELALLLANRSCPAFNLQNLPVTGTVIIDSLSISYAATNWAYRTTTAGVSVKVPVA